MAQREFRFEPAKDGLFLDIIHFGEDKPSYSIDIMKRRCTCKGFAIREKCRHFDRYIETLKSITQKLVDK